MISSSSLIRPFARRNQHVHPLYRYIFNLIYCMVLISNNRRLLFEIVVYYPTRIPSLPILFIFELNSNRPLVRNVMSNVHIRICITVQVRRKHVNVVRIRSKSSDISVWTVNLLPIVLSRLNVAVISVKFKDKFINLIHSVNVH